MAKKFLIAASAASLLAIPAAAQAQYYPGDPYYGRYDNRYDRGYNGRTYYGNRCSGTTGTVIGGVAGAVVGSQIAGGRRTYDYYGNRRGGSSATGAIIGGAVGALLGRKVDKDSCKRRNNGYNDYGYRY
ncbi:glycine zipper 2TM domain-containing protein [Sphingomonas sp. LHG3406-1]|uniref:glycine zipper 2TM domain-containing protein n=1 Tax=Sphingomonas sp. LHG3406-1 TaxID=2804617 RepID=UPI00262372DF|nr:glycine zipper 2TM domain-containing protein [Sphingomonas sp. LHG3406-1]